MSLENKAEALLEAATNLINAITDLVKGKQDAGAGKPVSADPGTKTKAETINYEDPIELYLQGPVL